MKITDVNVMADFVRTCGDGWLQGWHERNGGNLTYRLAEEEVEELRPFFQEPGPWMDAGVKAENLKGEFFIVTGSGKYFRHVPLKPQDNLCILEINDVGDRWRLVWGLEKGGVPTSELPTHLLNHSVRKAVTGGRARVIYHAHPAYIVAMTFVLPLTAWEFTRALWKSETECPIVFPRGVGVAPWMVPGGAEIAEVTSKLMEKYDAAVWAHHGLFVSGADLDEAFGLMHTIEKAAQIYMLARAGGHELQTIPDSGIREIAVAYKVDVNEEFLMSE